MRFHLRSRFVRTLAALVFAAGVIGHTSHLSGRGQGQAPDRARLDAFDSLAAYSADTTRDQTGQLLKQLGYQPAVPEAEWTRYPAQRKFSLAYVSAEAADPHRGGDRLLAALSQDLARRYDSVAQVSPLQPFMQMTRTPEPIRFARVAAPADLQLPAHVGRAIAALSEYTTGGPLGSSRVVLTQHFGLAADDADRLLRESASNHEAYRRAASRMDAPAQSRAISNWATAASRQYDAVAYDPAVAPFVERGPSAVHAVAPPTPPRPAIAPRPAGAIGAGERMGRVMVELPTPSFRVASRMIVGPGGILFGNRVTADAGLHPRTVRYVPGADPSTGVLRIALTDGTDVDLHDVPLEAAAVASRLAFSPTTRAPNAAAAGDTAIGIVGITDNTVHVACDSTRMSLTTSQLFNVALAPALVGTDLGWAALMVDALPVRVSQLFARVKASGNAEADAAVRDLFAMRNPAGQDSLGTWKVVDVEVVISRDGGTLVVERAPEAGHARPIGLRRTAFLEMRRFTAPAQGEWRAADGTVEYDRAFADRFYALMPVLAQSVGEYAQVNQLARALSVLRWARAEGASLADPVSEPRTIATPDAVRISDTAMTPVAPFDPEVALDRAERALEGCMDRLEVADPSVGAFASRVLTAATTDNGPALENLEGSVRTASPAIKYWWRLFLIWMDL